MTRIFFFTCCILKGFLFPSLDHIDYSYSANLTLNQMIEGKVLRAYVHGFYNDIPCVELFYANEETNEVGNEIKILFLFRQTKQNKNLLPLSCEKIGLEYLIVDS